MHLSYFINKIDKNLIKIHIDNYKINSKNKVSYATDLFNDFNLNIF